MLERPILGADHGRPPRFLALLPRKHRKERHFARLEEVAPMSNPRDFEPILDHIHVQVRDLEASRLTDEWEDAEETAT